jgi:hypothetical protein
MIYDNHWWPIASLFGGAIYLDAAGREAAKSISFKREGVRIGAETQTKLFFSSYIVMGIIGILLVSYSAFDLAAYIQ